jgi:hypothetical protein
LKSYSDLRVDEAFANITYSLSQVGTKPERGGKGGTTTTPDKKTIYLHLAALRNAGTDKKAFYLAFKKLKASKSEFVKRGSKINRGKTARGTGPLADSACLSMRPDRCGVIAALPDIRQPSALRF